MKINRFYGVVALFSSVLVGCGGGSSPVSTQQEVDIRIDNSIQVNSWKGINDLKLNIDIGSTPKDIYILLTNHAQSASESASISSNSKTVSSSTNKTVDTYPIEQNNLPIIRRAPTQISEFNRDLSGLKKTTDSSAKYKSLQIDPVKRADEVGDTTTFYLGVNSDDGSTNATERNITTVSTQYGDKTLNIWVSDDSFDSGSGCDKSTCVTQAMVDELMSTFLQDGDDNDIYDWVTSIYGEEWGGDTRYDNLISESNEITILLTDIGNDDSPNSGTIGYFYSKDNFTDISGSNQRVMFYIDSVMFANEDYGDYFVKEVYSTLAHEFTHMIDFYQKSVLRGTSHETWISEMLAETTEDLVATKIEHDGPRGVEYDNGTAGESGNTNGRYPAFNANNTLSLTTFNNTQGDYGKVNAFGTFLTRNYGGAKVLRDIMHNNLAHEDAVTYALGNSVNGADKEFDNVLREWGVGVLLSDKQSPEGLPTYNTGDFTYSSYNDITYQLGSINFFNYDPTPTLSNCTTVQPQGNCYHKIGSDLTGNITIDLSIGTNTEATLVVK